MDRRRSIIVGAAGVGAAVALLIVGRGGPSAPELQSAAAELDGRVRETEGAAQARATTLAQMPRLSWAVATDEQTMLDLTADELAFQPAAGELIEIGQVQRRDGSETRLRRVGDGSLHLPLGESGTRLLIADGRLYAASVVSIEPKTRADQIRGAVAVARPVDTAALGVRLRHAGIALRVDVPGSGSIVVGTAPKGAHEESLSLVADAARGARLTALTATSMVPPTGILVAAVVLLFGGLLAAGWMWKRAVPVAQPPIDPPLRDLIPEVHIDLRGDHRRR